MKYVIKLKCWGREFDSLIPKSGLFWNNKEGWVDLGNADIFSLKEKGEGNLPMDGEWKEKIGKETNQTTSP